MPDFAPGENPNDFASTYETMDSMDPEDLKTSFDELKKEFNV